MREEEKDWTGVVFSLRAEEGRMLPWARHEGLLQWGVSGSGRAHQARTLREPRYSKSLALARRIPRSGSVRGARLWHGYGTVRKSLGNRLEPAGSDSIAQGLYRKTLAVAGVKR